MAYYVSPSEQVGRTRPRVPHQIAPMIICIFFYTHSAYFVSLHWI